jgi:hypothetical protein
LKFFEKYNTSLFLLWLIILVLVFGCFLSIFKPGMRIKRIIKTFLGLICAWNGVVYHYLFISLINKAFYLFSTLF